MTTPYDIAIVGGGIAGLAIAEIFARSGHSVALVEKSDKLCQEASASQHGWFHFGSLYSIFPQNQFLRTMVGGVEDLLKYYAGYEGMNIVVGSDGRLEFPQRNEVWFRDEPIEYIVTARNDPDFDIWRFDGVKNYGRKLFFLLTWEMAIKQFISRHQRFWKHDWRNVGMASQWIPRAGWADYSRQVISKPDLEDVALDVDTHFRIVGYDRPMRATAIITDLVRGFLGAGGEIITGMAVQTIEKNGAVRFLRDAGGRRIAARRVVVAAGKWLGRFLPESDQVKVVASPLLVVYPAVTGRHFVRMTPFVEKSVNHIWHEVEGRRYSLIGGGYFADPDDADGVARATQKLKEMATRVFPRMAEATLVKSYLGYKAEIVPEAGERNYQYFMRQVDEGVWVAVPGKFSLAFSLAVNLFRRMIGRKPEKTIRLAPQAAATPYVGLTRHAEVVSNMILSRQ